MIFVFDFHGVLIPAATEDDLGNLDSTYFAEEICVQYLLDKYPEGDFDESVREDILEKINYLFYGLDKEGTEKPENEVEEQYLSFIKGKKELEDFIVTILIQLYDIDPSNEHECHQLQKIAFNLIKKYRNNIKVDWKVICILQDIVANNFKTAYLTNRTAISFELLKQIGLTNYFTEGGIVSYQTFTKKPFNTIYERLEDYIFKTHESLKHRDLVLIDDNEENIEAAQKRGWNGILYTSPEQLVNELDKDFKITLNNVLFMNKKEKI
jgi:phosphoglycolate phosphatase-like HAD superfamily hydrolase